MWDKSLNWTCIRWLVTSVCGIRSLNSVLLLFDVAVANAETFYDNGWVETKEREDY